MSADQFPELSAAPRCWVYRPSEPLCRRQQSTLARILLAHALRAAGRAEVRAPALLEASWGALRAELGIGVSISHTATVIAVALAPAALGVDVEIPTRQRNWMGMARSFFDLSEQAWLDQQSVEQRQSLFLRMWTLKEAGLKALGGELLEALASLYLPAPGERLVSRGERMQALGWCWSGRWDSVHLALAGVGPASTRPRFWLCTDLATGEGHPMDELLRGGSLAVVPASDGCSSASVR